MQPVLAGLQSRTNLRDVFRDSPGLPVMAELKGQQGTHQHGALCFCMALLAAIAFPCPVV